MANTYINISPLIPGQFPSTYMERGNTFIAFTKAYYEWMEQANNVNFQIRNLQNYRDIDKTVDDFILHFKLKYLNDIQFSTATNKRLIIKNAGELYNAKGTERGLELFFQLVFAEPISIEYPKDNIFKTSDNTWEVPIYLEVSNSPYLEDYIGQEIVGILSNATAFVDRLVRRRVNSKYINVFYISNIQGNFEAGEQLIISGNNTISDIPFFIGCLTSLDVIDGGYNFVVGETVNILSNNGAYATALVTSIAPQTDVVTFDLIDGGYGYFTNSEIIISNNILTIENINVTNTSLQDDPYFHFETIIQPKANITFQSATGNLAVGDVLQEWSNNVVVATGQIMSLYQSGANGEITISVLSGNMDSQSQFFTVGNTIGSTITVYTNKTASANIMGFANSSTLYLTGVVGEFIVGETITESSKGSTGIIKSLSVAGSNTSLFLNSVNGLFTNNSIISGDTSNAYGTLVNYITQIGVFNVNGAFSNLPYNYTYSNISNTTGSVTSVSTGNGASFNIGSLDYVSTAFINNDLLSANNTGGVPYMSIQLNGTNSNVSSNGYGFPADPSNGLANLIIYSLTFLAANIGAIYSLSEINQGVGYNQLPMIEILNQEVAVYEYYNVILSLANVFSSFTIGEEVTQQTLVANAAIVFYTGATTSFDYLEEVYESNGTANVATGYVNSINSTALTLYTVTGTFSNTYQITGVKSAAVANVVSVNTTVYSISNGIILSQPNSTTIEVKLMSFNTTFVTGSVVTGIQSAAQGNVVSVGSDFYSNVMGNNAIIEANLQFANGIVANLTPLNSGLGYINGELDIFTSLDGLNSGTVKVDLENQGYSDGRFLNNKSFLSDEQYLQDDYYYQEFSYVIKSAIPIENYGDMLKKVMHVSGLQLFGEVVISSIANVNVATVSANVTQS